MHNQPEHQSDNQTDSQYDPEFAECGNCSKSVLYPQNQEEARMLLKALLTRLEMSSPYALHQSIKGYELKHLCEILWVLLKREEE